MTDSIITEPNEDSLIGDGSPPEDTKPTGTYLETLVGEGKKFSDNESLAKGKYESDQYINRLQEENSTLRKELDTRLTLEEFMDKMNNSKPNNDTNNQEDNLLDESNHQENNNTRTLTEEDVRNLLNKEVSEREETLRRQRNYNLVQQKAEEVLGHDYRVVLGQRARELKLGRQFLENLAMENPESFLQIMVHENTVRNNNDTPVVPPTSSSNPNNSEVWADQNKNWVYYEKMRKENPREYFSVKVQNEMHNQAAKLGHDKFYGKQ